jgi:malate synthase
MRLLASSRPILTPDALGFVGELTQRFRPRLRVLLEERLARQVRLDGGEPLDFPAETESIRAASWEVAEISSDLRDRRVEITGPTDRKMVINALNSGASCFMADFEDSNSPTWANLVDGQQNLYDAVRRTIRFDSPDKTYTLNERTATLLVRPRGLHLLERHAEVDDEPVPAALFDFGLFLFQNARELVHRGTGPYFYLPKLESRHEAGWWAEVIASAEEELDLAPGTVKVTVLIETIPAAFEIDEILWMLRPNIVGLNCGRWDYIFSFIKRQRENPNCVFPDRSQVTMDLPFLRSYTRRVVEICHRRGALAIGGMAAQIPLKDPAANAEAIGKVKRDKLREVADGHDGTWVAHPGLVPVARAVFDAGMLGSNQLGFRGHHPLATREDLLRVPSGSRTEAGLRHNIRVAVRYLAAWLGGNGCVPIDGLMEDAATAEISRAQLWQWIHHAATLDDGRVVTADLVSSLVDAETAGFEADRTLSQARALFLRLSTADTFAEFLTLPAYDVLLENETLL